MNIDQKTLLRFLLGGLLLAAGCATTDVDPGTPQAGRGYVDLFTEPKANVWWNVSVFDARDDTFKPFVAQFNAPGLGIFRVAARPGQHRAKISFVNHAVEAPVEVEVDVKEGMITPVRVELEPGDSTYVRSREDRARWQSSRMFETSQAAWKISATPMPAIPYVRKEQTSYSK
jgi:hypothetical protein